jgi:hypothetical protein
MAIISIVMSIFYMGYTLFLRIRPEWFYDTNPEFMTMERPKFEIVVENVLHLNFAASAEAIERRKQTRAKRAKAPLPGRVKIVFEQEVTPVVAPLPPPPSPPPQPQPQDQSPQQSAPEMVQWIPQENTVEKKKKKKKKKKTPTPKVEVVVDGSARVLLCPLP